MRYVNVSLVTGFFVGFLSWSAVSSAQLQVGAVAPEFCCIDDQGKIWESRDHVGENYVVVYFYPSDFSSCCTRQAQCYRDSQGELAKLDAEVIGISGDVMEAHQAFRDVHSLQQRLLSDTGGHVASQFGVTVRNGGKAILKDKDGKETIDKNGHNVEFRRKVTTVRQTFIIDLDGRIAYHQETVSAIKDTQEVLECLRGLPRKKRP